MVFKNITKATCDINQSTYYKEKNPYTVFNAIIASKLTSLIQQGERKGVNKYYPPDYDPSKGGLNKFQGTHALRERARKLHMGILIIRFEMPYNIWCEGCENHIGTGVR